MDTFLFNGTNVQIEDYNDEISLLLTDDTQDANMTEFDYDINGSFEKFNYWDLIPTAIVYGFTLIMGLVASLATADLLLIIVCVPVKFGQLFSYTWEFGEMGCKVVHYMQNVSAICSVLTLTAMSIERYYAIIHPVRSRYLCTMSQTKRIIIFTWCFSVVAAIPALFIQVHYEVGYKYKAFWCVRDWSSPVLWRLYEIYMLIIVLIVPAMVMGYAYTCICHRLWIVIRQRASMMYGQENLTANSNPIFYALGGKRGTLEMNRLPDKDGASKQASAPSNGQGSGLRDMYASRSEDDTCTVKQVIKMLVAVVVLFIVCWSPILIINVLTAFDYLSPLNYGYLKPLRTGAHLMSYLNSCVNPVVYGFMSQNFRASFKAALSKCFRCRDTNAANQRASASASYHLNNSTTVVSRIPNSTNPGLTVTAVVVK
ncbi:Cholecystokinin receptor [Halotydeus destructor]|nr:Cholecystokinin receptor [Halotydeus destructor]